MNLTYFGQSAVRLAHDGHEIVIDPFLTGNPVCPVDADTLHPSYILLTHAHGDHVGDTEAIARRTGATVVSSYEIANWFGAKDVASHGMNPGGGRDFEFGRVTFTPAWHSSSFPDGTYGGMPMGIVVDMGGVTVYHAGDTALFGDMALIGRKGIDVALLPIGDNFTMGPDDAVEAVELIQPKRVVPIHYNTFELINQDAGAFKAKVEAETDAVVDVLEPGDSLEL